MKSSERQNHKKEKSIEVMLDLLNGTASSIDVDDLDINEQKEKADEIINELQEKIREITLEGSL